MSGDIYHDIRKLCNDVFCRKETLRFEFSVSMSKKLPPTPNSVTVTVNSYAASEDQALAKNSLKNPAVTWLD